jgi:hypothetical protein
LNPAEPEPDALALAAEQVRRGLALMRSGWRDCLTGTMTAATALARARVRLQSDQAFGSWCRENHFGEDVLSKNDRTALVAFGRDPQRACEVLEATHRRSLRSIYENDWRQAGGSQIREPKPEPPPASPQTFDVPITPASQKPQTIIVPVITTPAGTPLATPFVPRSQVNEAVNEARRAQRSADADYARESAEIEARFAADPDWSAADEIERLRGENDRLKAEVARLTAENDALRAELRRVEAVAEIIRAAGRKRKGPAT